jgi:hypothetical protein
MMAAVDPHPLQPDEAEPVAAWFRATLVNVRRLRETQDHVGAEFLLRRTRGVFAKMRVHGAAHGYSVDLMFADVAAALAAA